VSEWFTLDDARTRLGLHPDTLRRQVRRGQREGRKDNLGRWLVRVDPDESGRIDPGTRADGPDTTDRAHPDQARVAPGLGPDMPGQLREQVARLEERLAAAEAIRAELRERMAELRANLESERQRAEAAERRQAEQDRRLDDMLRQLAELRDERQRRRPWPGLIAWARRIVYGDNRGTGGAA
jgi:hypothetical protein